jgi:hypothetical protein
VTWSSSALPSGRAELRLAIVDGRLGGRLDLPFLNLKREVVSDRLRHFAPRDLIVRQEGGRVLILEGDDEHVSPAPTRSRRR